MLEILSETRPFADEISTTFIVIVILNLMLSGISAIAMLWVRSLSTSLKELRDRVEELAKKDEAVRVESIRDRNDVEVEAIGAVNQLETRIAKEYVTKAEFNDLRDEMRQQHGETMEAIRSVGGRR